jgi:hypothetical protein
MGGQEPSRIKAVVGRTGPPEPVFVDLLKSHGIDSQPAGRYDNPICRTGLPGYIGWQNRFLGIDFMGSINVYKYGLRLYRLAESIPWNLFLAPFNSTSVSQVPEVQCCGVVHS